MCMAMSDMSLKYVTNVLMQLYFEVHQVIFFVSQCQMKHRRLLLTSLLCWLMTWLYSPFVGFVVDTVALGQIFFLNNVVYPVSAVSSMCLVPSCITRARWSQQLTASLNNTLRATCHVLVTQHSGYLSQMTSDVQLLSGHWHVTKFWFWIAAGPKQYGLNDSVIQNV